MARVVWPLATERPAVQIVLASAQNGTFITRTLLADTGAGRAGSRFHVLLRVDDWQACGKAVGESIVLGAAYSGAFDVALVRVQIPALGFNRLVRAVGIRTPPKGLDGIAGFRFLNRFTYGNFGDAQQFGLET